MCHIYIFCKASCSTALFRTDVFDAREQGAGAQVSQDVESIPAGHTSCEERTGVNFDNSAAPWVRNGCP